MADKQPWELDAEAGFLGTFVLVVQEPAGLTPAHNLVFDDLMQELSDGAEATPAVAFRLDPDTGPFRIAANQYGIACGGDTVAAFVNDATDNYINLQENASQVGALLRLTTIAGNTAKIAALGADAAVDVELVPKGAGGVEMLSSRFLGWVSSGAAPTTTELPTDHDWCIHEDTVGVAITLAVNDGGAIKTVTLA